MARLLLEYLWSPVIKDVAKSLGFRTPRALDVVRRGMDHHRSHHILTIVFEALSQELLNLFVRACLHEGTNVSDVKFFAWLSEVENSTYLFLLHMNFTFLLSIHLYTAAIRKNNSSIIMASCTAFAPLFYGKSHGKYQELLLRDMCMRVNMPQEVRLYVESTESFSLTGSGTNGQGADFLQEEANREVKSLLPSGAVTQDTWLKVNNTTELVKDMKERLVPTV